MHNYTFSFLLLLFCNWAMAQAPINDHCDQARPIQMGENFTGLFNGEATVSDLETPEKQPITCIESFENDLWFSFTTAEHLSYYKVTIQSRSCNTPAGLQALLIETDDCNPGSYLYRACVNHRSEEDIKLFLEESEPGKQILIYVDGYDGTECAFELFLEGFQNNPQTLDDIRSSQNDYGDAPPEYEMVEASVEFLNNEAVIKWTDASQSSTVLFVVQRVTIYGSNKFGKSVHSIEPVNTVGEEEEVTYTYTDTKRFLPDEKYCYRIVRVDVEGQKFYSIPFCQTAKLEEDLFISPVYPNPSVAGGYIIKFINKRKQDLTFSVLDESEETLKSMTRQKEPQGDGSITIDMKSYDPGIYFLKVVGSKSGYYQRKFEVE